MRTVIWTGSGVDFTFNVQTQCLAGPGKDEPYDIKPYATLGCFTSKQFDQPESTILYNPLCPCSVICGLRFLIC